MGVRQDFKGDFMGFTYNGKHSSSLGIVRVNDGSRFNENLLPTIQDKTVQVPGGDGTYYFGSYYTQRQFTISFAFDDLTEERIAEMRAHFGDKQIHDLIFDETPYKVYSAKVTGTSTLKYICFDEGPKSRLYKGEGSIQFTCYFPFARCRFMHNVKKEDKRDIFPNIDEWWEASGITENKNFGDIDAPFKLTITKGKGSIATKNGTITWDVGERTVVLNTQTGLATNGGKIVNELFAGNLTMKIPAGAELQTTGTAQPSNTNNIIRITGNADLSYHRYYF